MSKRPQYSLKALFIIMAALAVPLGMLVSGNTALSFIGYFILASAALSSLRYVLKPWTLTSLGKAVAEFVLFIVFVLLVLLGLMCLPDQGHEPKEKALRNPVRASKGLSRPLPHQPCNASMMSSNSLVFSMPC